MAELPHKHNVTVIELNDYKNKKVFLSVGSIKIWVHIKKPVFVCMLFS
jgi:hypothetical protein